MKSLLQQLWNSKWALSLSFGILLGFSFPPFPFPFFTFISFILLLRLIDLSPSAKAAAYWSYPGFVVWNIIGTYWLVLATVSGGIAAILANAAVMTLPVMLIYQAQKHFSQFSIIALLQTAFWVSYEFLHHQWDLAWPWLVLGNAWSNVPELIQYISATGYLGISAWVVLTSALAYQALKSGRRDAAVGSLGIALLLPAISLFQLSYLNSADPVNAFKSGSTADIPTAEVVVTQPNFDSYESYGGLPDAQSTMDLLTHFSDSLLTEKTNLVVWPENSIHPPLHSAPGRKEADRIKARVQSAAARWNVTVVGGATYFEYYSEQNSPPLPRYSADRPYLYYNSALGFYPDTTLQVYRKYNLVPIVERIPFVHALSALDLFQWVDWAQIQGYGKGSAPNQFRVWDTGTQTPGLVCYDSVFPSWVREFVTDGAGFITIITNDGWWGYTSGHIQHFAYARLRALEFRRWIVRSANNGISGIIAPDGTIKKKTAYWTRTAFRYEVPILDHQTIYAQFGDWLPYLLMMISAGGIIAFLYEKYR